MTTAPTTPRRRSPTRLPRGSRVAPASGVITCPQTGGLVLLDMGDGRRITLDGFGRRVWQALADGPSLARLLTVLHDDDTPAERLAEDVMRLLARWSARDLIIWR